MTSSFSRRCLLSRLLLVSLLASLVRSSCALRVAFVADSGIGNENAGDYWIDHWGNERAPRNLYYQYVYQLFLAGNLDPACPFERLTGLKKDAENPPNFFL